MEPVTANTPADHPADPSATSLPNLIPFSRPSSHLTHYHYDPLTRVLAVRMGTGSIYHHANVPAEAVSNFTSYRSPGEFYHMVIKRYKIIKQEQGKETPNGKTK